MLLFHWECNKIVIQFVILLSNSVHLFHLHAYSLLLAKIAKTKIQEKCNLVDLERNIVTSYKTRKKGNCAFVRAKWMAGLRSVTKEFTGVITDPVLTDKH